MRSSFFGLNIALSGLYSAQKNLNTVNHNLANVNTPGYSRQQAVQRASRPLGLYDGTGMVGTGSEVISISRIRDQYLDRKFWSENIALGEWQVKRDILAEIERVFNEPSVDGSGFNKVMDDFYKAIDDLSKDPGSLSARKVLINRGISLTKYFNNVAAHFEKMQADANDAIRLKVDEINSLGEQIRNLNEQIIVLEASGDIANDLRDRRDALVDELSQLVNIEVYETVAGKLPDGREDKHFVVAISGKPLVDHCNMTKLKVTQRKNKINDEDIENLYEVSWEDGNDLEVRGGELKGYLDMRDGNEGINGTPNYKGIPYYIRKLNEFVRKFARTINEGLVESTGADKYIKKYSGHADGYGLQKPGTTVNPTGIRFFTVVGWSAVNNRTTELTSDEFMDGVDMSNLTEIGDAYEKITAKNFSISGDLLNQQFAEYNIAASKEAGFPEDNSNLLVLLEMRHDTHLFAEGAPEDYMKSLVSTLGIDSQHSIQIAKNQENLTRQIENRRLSVSGVSLDEEMANMVKYQHAYNAAAKMIATMAEIYDVLINRIGV